MVGALVHRRAGSGVFSWIKFAGCPFDRSDAKLNLLLIATPKPPVETVCVPVKRLRQILAKKQSWHHLARLVGQSTNSLLWHA
jgi:hypothetical protein